MFYVFRDLTVVQLTGRMAIGLPAPMNDILTFWLPPTFEQIKTNTLGFALRRTDLTWEELVVSVSDNLVSAVRESAICRTALIRDTSIAVA